MQTPKNQDDSRTHNDSLKVFPSVMDEAEDPANNSYLKSANACLLNRFASLCCFSLHFAVDFKDGFHQWEDN